MRVTKADLEKQIEAANSLIRKYRDESYDFKKEIESLKSDIKSKDQDLEARNKHMEFTTILLDNIVTILAGKSSKTSKSEAITDLLQHPVSNLKRMNEEREKVPQRQHDDSRFYKFEDNNFRSMMRRTF